MAASEWKHLSIGIHLQHKTPLLCERHCGCVWVCMTKEHDTLAWGDSQDSSVVMLSWRPAQIN